MSRGDGPEGSKATSRGHEADVDDAPLAKALLARIESAAVRVGIIGLGYVGLPLARAFSDHGIAVLGFDVDPIKVDRLERGRELHRAYPRRGDPPDARAGIRGHGRLSAAG